MNSPKTEKRIHYFFEVTLVFKGIHAFLELLSGLLLFVTSQSSVISFITVITAGELAEDPKSFIAMYLLTTADSLSLSGQHFISLYLISHGIIKGFAIVGLLYKKAWAYPTSILVFSCFIVYQLYRYTSTHSPWLLLLTLFDVILIVLTIHEYTLYKRKYNF